MVGRSPHRDQGDTHRGFISRPQHEQTDFQVALGPRREVLRVREQQPFPDESVFWGRKETKPYMLVLGHAGRWVQGCCWVGLSV